MPIHLDKVRRAAGFPAPNILPGQYGWLLVKAALTSDDPMLHAYMGSNGETYLSQAKLNPNTILCFVLVFHVGDTADLYVNREVNYLAEARVKRSVKAGEVAYLNNLADI